MAQRESTQQNGSWMSRRPWRDRDVARPPQPKAWCTRPGGLSVVRMRDTAGRERHTWAALVKRYREAAGMSPTTLARRLGTDRGTIYRWESGTYTPRRPDVVIRFADLFRVDLDVALAAAGLRPQVDEAGTVAPTPALALDPDVLELQRMLDDPRTPESVKAQIRAVAASLRQLAADVAAERGARRVG